MKRPHLYLTGYRGCGKSTVAKLLSDNLALPFFDLDIGIEEAAGTTIAEIFASEGEAGFRDRETKCLQEIAELPQRVVALGGGAILRPENRQLISTSGWCVWLDAAPAVIADRLTGDATTRERRPSLTGKPVAEEIVEVMTRREPLYREVADLRIDTSETPIEEIVSEIVAAFAAVK
ncbi:shikimate kinase [Aporhodopirellula aestuarii]|uniref:Shikimate kinase n=1 Tax=Aporhodopirellula aestuarii TaxID=2950107 RepID=A0ABT0TXV1_9BACT|nr:shikimate kinase [Aporhodopirellula aestuarii]MCM2369417.1 shikimate kinase [Aporhodopirellula aestuarii]